MAQLDQVLTLVHGALEQASPNTRQQEQLAEAQRQLLEIMWLETVVGAAHVGPTR
jgi:hypothetical protein